MGTESVPIRIEIGPKEIEKQQIIIVRRYDGKRFTVKDKELEKKTELWIFRFFSPIFGYYALILLLLFIELYVISNWGIIFVVDIFYKILIIFSSFGILLFLKFISDLAVMK